MTRRPAPICYSCARFQGIPDDATKGACEAFPAGIPDAIWQGRGDHRKRWPNDGGLMFEQDPTKPDADELAEAGVWAF